MDKKPGIINIPDRSNGTKSLKRPKNCHCHCAPVVVGVTKDTLVLAPHRHYGKGGWWKNGECDICNSK